MAKIKVFKKGKKILSIIFLAVFVVILIASYIAYQNASKNTAVEGEMTINFFDLGNNKDGDCFLIQIGKTEILVDGGSHYNSLPSIKNFINQKLTDGIIEYAIITHADTDHIACFAGSSNTADNLFKSFTFQTIIDFPQTDKTTQVYSRYVANRDASSAKHVTALDCYKNQNGGQREYVLANNVVLEFLYQTYYENKSSSENKNSNENNYSVCFQINFGNKHFLFTGDLETDGEKSLVQNNNLSQVEFYKAGHHGSSRSSSVNLLSVIKPKICVVSCIAGGESYGFPKQEFIDRIAEYTNQVYIPVYATDNSYASLNGNITIKVNNEETSVICSNNQTLLKDTSWFKQNRQTPNAWK